MTAPCHKSKVMGASLSSFMVGLLISIVGILASLTLYRTLIEVAATAKVDAIHDGQLATSLLAIQLKVQNAGFGLAGSVPHIMVVSSADKKSLFWRYKINNTVYCEGLERYEKPLGDKTIIALDFMSTSTANCNEVSQLSAIAWTSRSPLAGFDKNITDIIDFALAKKSCSPYGVGSANEYGVLSLSGKLAAGIEGAEVNSQSLPVSVIDVCLSNIKYL